VPNSGRNQEGAFKTIINRKELLGTEIDASGDATITAGQSAEIV
jgi:hypothetical protein